MIMNGLINTNELPFDRFLHSSLRGIVWPGQLESGHILPLPFADEDVEEIREGRREVPIVFVSLG